MPASVVFPFERLKIGTMVYPQKIKQTVFIVDMDHNTRDLIRRWMDDEGYRVESFINSSGCLETMSTYLPDVIILDMLTISNVGHNVLVNFRELDSHAALILLYHERFVDFALKAIKNGAFDFHLKPLERLRLSVSVRNAADKRTLENEIITLRKQLKSIKIDNESSVISTGLSMRDLEEQAIKTALLTSGGNVSKTARILGIGRTTLYRKMTAFGIADPSL